MWVIVGGGGAEVLFGGGASAGTTEAGVEELVKAISSRIVAGMAAPAFAGSGGPYPVVLGLGAGAGLIGTCSV
jgi:hypothetical protein